MISQNLEKKTVIFNTDAAYIVNPSPPEVPHRTRMEQPPWDTSKGAQKTHQTRPLHGLWEEVVPTQRQD